MFYRKIMCLFPAGFLSQKFLGSSFLMNFRINDNFPSPPLDLKINVGRIEIYAHHTSERETVAS